MRGQGVAMAPDLAPQRLLPPCRRRIDHGRGGERSGWGDEAQHQAGLDLAAEPQRLVGVGEQADLDAHLGQALGMGVGGGGQIAVRPPRAHRPVHPGLHPRRRPAPRRADLAHAFGTLDLTNGKGERRGALTEPPCKPHAPTPACAGR